MTHLLTGPLGVAYQCKTDHPLWEVSVSAFAINLPNYHPMLKWFLLSVCHLEPSVYYPPALKINKTATHELSFYDIDPESYLFEDVNPKEIHKYKLSPHPIFETQLDNLKNTEAAMLLDLLTAHVLDGTLLPDPYTKKQWFETTHANQKWLSK